MFKKASCGIVLYFFRLLTNPLVLILRSRRLNVPSMQHMLKLKVLRMALVL